MAEPQNLSPAAQKQKTLLDSLQRASKSMSAVAASMVTPDKLIKIGVAAAQRNPLLLECTPQSIVRAVIQGAELGLTPGSALNQAYLVPFRNGQAYEAQLIISAAGLCELAYRSGMVASIQAEVVYRGDQFEYELGLEPKLRHIPAGETNNSDDITHAYMVVIFKDGTKNFKVMTRADVDRIRKISKAANNGPWVQHYGEMARKTVLKLGMKYIPKSIEVARAVAQDNAVETGDWFDVDFEAPEAIGAGAQSLPEPPSTTEKVAGKVEKATEGTPQVDPVTGETLGL